MGKAIASTYAERLAYARWVRALTAGGMDESDQELIRRSGVKQSWFSKWKDSVTPPPRHIELSPLAGALGVTMDFLLGAGPPPLPGLWADWMKARRGQTIADAERRYGLPDTTTPADQGGRRDIREGAVALTPAQIARAEEKAARLDAEAAASRSVRPIRRRGTRER